MTVGRGLWGESIILTKHTMTYSAYVLLIMYVTEKNSNRAKALGQGHPP